MRYGLKTAYNPIPGQILMQVSGERNARSGRGLQEFTTMHTSIITSFRWGTRLERRIGPAGVFARELDSVRT